MSPSYGYRSLDGWFQSSFRFTRIHEHARVRGWTWSVYPVYPVVKYGSCVWVRICINVYTMYFRMRIGYEGWDTKSLMELKGSTLTLKSREALSWSEKFLSNLKTFPVGKERKRENVRIILRKKNDETFIAELESFMKLGQPLKLTEYFFFVRFIHQIFNPINKSSRIMRKTGTVDYYIGRC